MGTLVFQANLGGAVNLIGPNTASTVNFTLPSADGTSGQALVTNGSGILSFSTFTTGAAGSNTQVQFNSSGAFAGSANLTFDGTTLTAAGLSGPHNGTVGATTPNTGAFTTLSASSTVTLSGGTANGVGYLNGSKQFTTGSALTFDGSNLGVGAGTVAAKLHVQSTVGNNGADNTGMLLVESTYAGNASQANASLVAKNYYGNFQVMQWQNFGARIGSRVTANGGAGEVVFTYGNDSEGMRLTSTGLGIGTSSPAYKLDVNGTFNSKTATITNISDNVTTIKAQYTTDGTSIAFFKRSDNAFSAVINNATTAPLGGTQVLDVGASAGGTSAVFNGNVGIGTSSPSVKLDVSGAIKASSYIQFGAGATTSAIYTYGANTGGGIAQWVDNSLGTGTGWTGASGAYNSYIGTVTNTSLGFATNSTVRAILDNSGNLGLGVTPSAWNTGNSIRAMEFGGGSIFSYSTNEIDLVENAYYDAVGWKYKNTNLASRYTQYQGVHSWSIAPSGTAGNAISFTQAMTLDASGNWQLGTTNAGTGARAAIKTSICVLDSAETTANYVRAGDGYLEFEAYRGTTADIRFRTTSGGAVAERARIDSSGNLLVGFTSNPNTARIYVRYDDVSTQPVINSAATTSASTSWSHFIGQSGNGSSITTNNIFIRGNGNIENANNSYGAISDAKLKENITDATPKLEKLCQVRVVNYNLIGDYEKHKQLGVIAQELEQVFPGMVEETPDRDAEGNDLGTTTKSVKYSVFVPMLIKAVQELTARVAQLEGK